VTPNPVRNRQRRFKPLPLCLSDNEKNMPVLTVIPSDINVGNIFLNKKKLLLFFHNRNEVMMKMKTVKILVQ
jgi:hypothetical protein